MKVMGALPWKKGVVFFLGQNVPTKERLKPSLFFVRRRQSVFLVQLVIFPRKFKTSPEIRDHLEGKCHLNQPWIFRGRTVSFRESFGQTFYIGKFGGKTQYFYLEPETSIAKW